MRSVWLGAWALCWSSAGYAQRPVIAVFDIEDRSAKISADALESLVDLIETRLVSSGRYQVVPRAQLKSAMNREKSASFKECYDESCQIEVGKELAAEKTAATRIAKLGGSCLVTIKIYDLRKATAEAGKDEKGACSEEGVYTSLGSALGKLLGVPSSVSVSPSDASIASSVAPAKSDPLAEGRAAEAKEDHARAARLYEQWHRSLPKKDERVPEALFLLSRAQYRSKNPKKALRNFKSFLRKSKRRSDLFPQQIEGYAWAAAHYEKQGKLRNAKSYYLRCLKIVERVGWGEVQEPFAGQCAVHGSKLMVREFSEGKFRVGRMKSMAKKMKRKASDFGNIQRKLMGLISKSKDPNARLGLLYQTAMLHEGFARVLRRVPAPKKLSAEQADVFVSEIESHAFRMEDEGRKLLQQVLERGKKEQLENEWTRQASAKLNRSR